MPQSDRSKTIKALVKWLVHQDPGATTAGIHAQVRNEITELGATQKTIQSYIEDLDHAGIIEYEHPYWKVTKFGREWLERHSI